MDRIPNYPTRLIESAARLVLFTFAAVVLFARMVSARISHDEYQFVASAQVLVSQGLLPYRDYPFLHMPYQIAVNALGIWISEYHFLVLRSLHALSHLASVLVLFFLVDRLFRNHSWVFSNTASSLAVLYFLFDPALVAMDGRALNHALPVLLSLMALATFQWTASREQRLVYLALCGGLVGLAAGIRLTFAVLPASFLLLMVGQNSQTIVSKGRNIAAFLSGLVLSLLPVVGLVFIAPEKFFFGNFFYMRLNTIYRQSVQFQTSMDPQAKAQYFFETIFNHPGSLVLYVGLIVVLYDLFRRLRAGRDLVSISPYLPAIASPLLLAATLAPTPVWPQYFFAPIPFVILSVFYGLAQMENVLLRRLAALGLALALFSTFPYHPIKQQISIMLDPTQWVPIQAHRFANLIQETLPPGKVATLAPIFPLEAGLDTYPPFLVGPFVWRTAPLLSANGRQSFGLTSFHELDELLDADPPVAILVGFETDYGFDAYSFGELEKPLVGYALRRNYQPSLTFKPAFWPGEITLWTRPEGP